MLKSASILLVFVFAFAFSGNAQNRITKHCYITAKYYNGFTITRFKIAVQRGNIDSLFSFKDSSVISELRKVEQLNNLADVLNFMEVHDWKLTSINSIGNYGLHELFFHREFDKSEMKTDPDGR